jgi:dihydrofolate synthase/folylpolyglutamate synthase
LKQQLELAGVDSAAFDWAANSQALAKGGIAKQPPEKSVQSYESVGQAYAVVTSAVPPNDRILVFGSFLVVAQAMQAKEALRKRPG